MIVQRIELRDFRNYGEAIFELTSGVTAVVGENGQGKTNLAEAMAYLATLESFRGVTPDALVRLDSEQAVVRAEQCVPGPFSEIRSSLERVMQFADERSRAIKFRAVDGEVMLHSSLSDTGESEETLNVNYNGPKVDIGFNAQYLLDFLKATGSGEVRLEFKDAQSAGQLRPGESEECKYRYIVMPMRI